MRSGCGSGSGCKGGGCPPCAPGQPTNCCPSGLILQTLFAVGVPGSVLPGGTAAFIPVPGMTSGAFTSPAAERLLIDAGATVLLSGGVPPYVAFFRVLVDGTPVPSGGFEVLETGTADMQENAGTTLLVTVPAGPHVVTVEWESPGAGAGSSATLTAGTLRVIRVSGT